MKVSPLFLRLINFSLSVHRVLVVKLNQTNHRFFVSDAVPLSRLTSGRFTAAESMMGRLLMAFVIVGASSLLVMGKNSTGAVNPSASSVANASIPSSWNITEVSTERPGSGSESGSGSGSGSGNCGEGTVKCPSVIRVSWNQLLARKPYADPYVDPETQEVTCEDGFLPCEFIVIYPCAYTCMWA